MLKTTNTATITKSLHSIFISLTNTELKIFIIFVVFVVVTLQLFTLYLIYYAVKDNENKNITTKTTTIILIIQLSTILYASIL